MWPQQRLSAACSRVFGLSTILNKLGFEIKFVSSQNHKGHKDKVISKIVGTQNCFFLEPNERKSNDEVLQSMGDVEFVLFDTFVSEEYFGNYAFRNWPSAKRILDTQDLHSLRIERMKIAMSEPIEAALTPDILSKVIYAEVDSTPETIHAREMASIFRCDHSLFVSDFEINLLNKKYGFPSGYISPSRFYYTQKEIDVSKANSYRLNYSFERRKNLVWIGNFNHPPNLQAAQILIQVIYPELKKRLGNEIELHIYGANFPKEIKDLCSDPKYSGVKARGLMKSIDSLSKYKLLVAPLIFGAGIKGKITDSWINLLPVVTTPIGAEGLILNKEQNQNNQDYFNHSKQCLFGGRWDCWNVEQFVEQTFELYTDKVSWEVAIQDGLHCLKESHSLDKQQLQMEKLLLTIGRDQLPMGGVVQDLLWNETLKSTSYLHKLINLKS